jgi:hypothetical protein
MGDHATRRTRVPDPAGGGLARAQVWVLTGAVRVAELGGPWRAGPPKWIAGSSSRVARPCPRRLDADSAQELDGETGAERTALGQPPTSRLDPAASQRPCSGPQTFSQAADLSTITSAVSVVVVSPSGHSLVRQ